MFYTPVAIPVSRPAGRSIADNPSAKGVSRPAVAPLQKISAGITNNPVLQRVVIHNVTLGEYKVSVDHKPAGLSYIVKKGEDEPETLSAEEMKVKYADLWKALDHEEVEEKVKVRKQRTAAADWIKEKNTANIKWPYYTTAGLDAIHSILRAIDFERTLEPSSKEKNRRQRWKKRMDRMNAQLEEIAEANCFYHEFTANLEDDVKEIVKEDPPTAGRGLKERYSDPKARQIWKSYTPYAVMPEALVGQVHELVMAITKKPAPTVAGAAVEKSDLVQWRAIRKKLLQRAPAEGALTYAITADGKIAGTGKSGWAWNNYFSISRAGVVSTDEPELKGFAAKLSEVDKVESLGRSILACGEVSAATYALLNGIVGDVDSLFFATSEQQVKPKVGTVKRLLKRCEHCEQWAKSAYTEPL